MNRKKAAPSSRAASSRATAGSSTADRGGAFRLRRRLAITGALTVLSLAIAAYLWADWYYGLPDSAEPKFVGRETCAQCHERQSHAWQGSHHDLAMDVAQEMTVLGDFKDAELTHHGITSRMFKRDGKFFVNTEGPDGQMADFEIKYVFGVDPLQ